MSLTRTRAVAAVSNDLFRFAMPALFAAALLAFAPSQANAQKGPGTPAEPVDLIGDAVEICAMIVNDLEEAENQLPQDGWTVEYSDANGPFVWEISASKIYTDGSDAYIFALIETYPAGAIAYCSYDAQSVPGTLDLEAVAADYDVQGTVQHNGDGAYGTWQDTGTDGTYYVLASQDAYDNYFYFQMTFVASNGTTGAIDAGK
jgi:hypothetical protein